MRLTVATNLGTFEIEPPPADEEGRPSAALRLLAPEVTADVGLAKPWRWAPHGPPSPRLAALPPWAVALAGAALLVGAGVVIGLASRR